MHFLGPIRGVLPIGPNGFPAFSALKPSVFDTSAAEMISYNYTLDHQGFASNISCKYDKQSPIRYSPVPDNTLQLSYSASCIDTGLVDVLINVMQFSTLNTNNTLTSWACQSTPVAGQEPTYYIYLRGSHAYETAIGNITCTLYPIQPAVFSVLYQSALNVFTASMEPTATFPNTFPEFSELALVALSSVVWGGQNVESNLVAELVIDYGVKSFNLPPYNQADTYLLLYEKMIQGIIEYEVCLVN